MPQPRSAPRPAKGIDAISSTSSVLPGSIRVVRYPDLGDPRFVDWVDYGERYADDSLPQRFVDQLLPQVARGASVWVDYNGDYRKVGTQCDRVVALLAAALGPGQQPVSGDNVKFFEYSNLIRFAPRS
jgi:hypothetical protein